MKRTTTLGLLLAVALGIVSLGGECNGQLQDGDAAFANCPCMPGARLILPGGVEQVCDPNTLNWAYSDAGKTD